MSWKNANNKINNKIKVEYKLVFAKWIQFYRNIKSYKYENMYLNKK